MLAKKKFESVSQLFSFCTELYKQKSTSPLNAFVVFPIGKITPEDIAKHAKKRGLIFRSKKTGNNIYFVKIGVKKRILAFQLVVNEGWWLFLGEGRSRILRDVFLGSFIGNHFSWLLQSTYLNTDQMATILNDLGTKFKHVHIRGCRYYQPGVTKLEFRQKGFQISYYEGLLTDLENDSNGTLSAIKVEFYNSGTLRNKVRILTQSQMTFYGGYFTDFYQSVILPFVEEALNTKLRFTDRQRRIKQQKVMLSSTEIKCREKFEPDQIEALQKILVRNYSTSVVYYNPVLIAHVTDRTDGSCFDIYLEGNTIKIVPLNRATSGGFTQLFSLLVRYAPQVTEIRDEPLSLLS